LFRVPWAMPPDEVVQAFADQTSSLLALIAVNRRETDALAATRDYLLPKLLSGEVHVGTGAGLPKS